MHIKLCERMSDHLCNTYVGYLPVFTQNVSVSYVKVQMTMAVRLRSILRSRNIGSWSNVFFRLQTIAQ